MKIGIITFHFAHNYGAMLQAYALQETLAAQGHEVGIIDYEPNYHLSKFPRKFTWYSCVSPSIKTFAHNVLKKILSLFYYRKRYASFVSFTSSRMKLLSCPEGFDGTGYDCIVVGSDQIWNPKLTGGTYDGMYFGENFKCPVISYAASNQASSLPDCDKERLSSLLSGLKSIGVRELKLKDLLAVLTEKEISVNLDPTLISDKSIYSGFKLPKRAPKKYVLIYEIGTHCEVQRLADAYAKLINVDVVRLTGTVTYKTLCGFQLTEGPEEFVSYIRNAECVFTTSFHGTALSIINQTAFYCFRQGTVGDLRMESLLTQLNLLDRFVPMGADVKVKVIDYKAVTEKLDELKKMSCNYLFNAIQ